MNKGLLGKAKIPVVLLSVILIAIFVINFVLPSFAVGGSAGQDGPIVSGALVQTNKMDYNPEDTALISGSGFAPNSNIVSITVTRPDLSVDSCPTANCTQALPITDASGSFSNYPYILDGIKGVYTVNVSDGTTTAQTIFTDLVQTTPLPNPVIAACCGIDIALVIDNSNSIDSTELAQMKTALIGFVDALSGTPTMFSVTKFGTTATVIQTFTNNFTSVKAAINSVSTGGGGTNWKLAISTARGTFDPRTYKPNLMIFASDGNPTYPNCGGSTTCAADVDAAIIEANTAKSSPLNIRILSVGIGDGLNVANLEAISGTNVNTGANSDVITTNFSTIAQDLASLSNQFCGGTISVKKLVGGQPASGWNFTTSVTGGTSIPIYSITGPDGFINPMFNITNIAGPTATASVTETLQGGYDFNSANCQYQNHTSAGTPGTGTVTGIVIGQNDSISCEFDNTAHQCDTDAQCQDSTVCTTDTCVNHLCVHTNNNNQCSDSNACTSNDQCSAGICVPGTQLNCDDSNVCTDDSCNALTGCVHTPNTASCDDGNQCTVSDVCSLGSCTSGTPRNCDDGDSCTIDSCNPNTGCVHTLNGAAGPVTSNLIVIPSFNNGLFNATAIATGTCSPINRSEYFLGYPGTTGSCGFPGSGTPMDASDGSFDQLVENVNKTNIFWHVDGVNWICVQSQNTAGNWGNCVCTYFETDITPPECAYNIYLNNALNANEYMVCDGSKASLNATVCDVQSFIQGGEYFIDTSTPVPAPWSGIWMTDLYNFTKENEHCSVIGADVNLTSLSDGTHYIKLRGKDSVENWGKIQNCNSISFIVDTKAPITTKILTPADGKQQECGSGDITAANLPFNASLTDGCEFVKSGTQITLNAHDQDTPDHEYSDNAVIYWKVWYKVNPADPWTLDQSGVSQANQNVTITLNKDSYHLIEYWSADSCSNMETHHYELDIVDTKPPVTAKTVGEPKLAGDGFTWITQQTPITLSCADQNPHPSDHVTLYAKYKVDNGDWVNLVTDNGYVQFTFNEDSVHTLKWHCVDILGNAETEQTEVDKVDSTPPTTKKTYGSPFYGTEGNVTEWINSSTPITLTTADGGAICAVDNTQTYWMNTIVDSSKCADQRLCQPTHTYTDVGWNLYTGPFYKPTESCHMIEYYSVDALGNKEPIKAQCVYVENTPPVSAKTVGVPNKNATDTCASFGQGTFTNGCYYVTQQTPITLTCSEQGPHPTGAVSIYYKVDWKQNSGDDWTLGSWVKDSNSVTFSYPQDSYHKLTWYCVDALNNTETQHTELDVVDTQAPVSQKSLGDPKHACTLDEQTSYYPGMPSPTDGCYFINQTTPITLTCSDGQPHPVDSVNIKYKDWLVGGEEPDWTTVNDNHVTITKTEDSAHILKWYCVDALGNAEQTRTEYDIVDTKPPVTAKTVGEPKLAGDGFTWITQQTPITLSCADQNPHPSDHVTLYAKYKVDNGDWVNLVTDNGYVQFTFNEDSVHTLKWHCVDILGNAETEQTEVDKVDSTPPSTIKTYGTPLVTTDGGYPKWITSQTPVTLTATDGGAICAVDNTQTYWMNTLVDNSYCQDVAANCKPIHNYESQGWNLYTSPFYKNEDSCHMIEYYSVDALGNKEPIKAQCVYIDNKPPVSTKTVGEPKLSTDCRDTGEGTFTDGCYFVTQNTPITLTCADQQPHPVDSVNIYYKIDWKNNSGDDWTLGSWVKDSNSVTFSYPQDSYHKLTWYCVDALNNTETQHTELDMVNTLPPVTTKIVGEPKVSCGENCWYITNETEISLSCEGQGPHPLNDVNIYYRYFLDNELVQDWTMYTQPFTLPEYSNHTVQYYCVDTLGNRGDTQTETDKVDNKPPVIIPDPCHNAKSEDQVLIWAVVTDDKVGVDPSSVSVTIEGPNGYEQGLELTYNPETGRYEGMWTAPSGEDVDGVYYVDFEASDLLGNTAELDNGKFIIVDNHVPTVYSVFAGRNWIGLGDKFYVDAEVDDNSLYFEKTCQPLTCLVRVLDNQGKEKYLQGTLQMLNGVMKCGGFVTDNETFYEAQAELFVDAIDGSGNMDSAVMDMPIGIDNSKMMSIDGVDSENWFRGGDWISNVVATVDSSKFGEVTSCSASISGVSPENTLQPVDNTCVGNIRIPVDISDGVKNLTISATNINGKMVSDSVNVRIDNTPPEKQIISPVNGTYYTTDIPVIMNVTDELSGVYNASFRVTKDPWTLFGLIVVPGTGYDSGWILTAFNGTTWNYDFNASVLTPGDKYYFLPWVCDNAGNCQDPVSYTITIAPKTTETTTPSVGGSSGGSSGGSGGSLGGGSTGGGSGSGSSSSLNDNGRGSDSSSSSSGSTAPAKTSEPSQTTETIQGTPGTGFMTLIGSSAGYILVAVFALFVVVVFLKKKFF